MKVEDVDYFVVGYTNTLAQVSQIPDALTFDNSPTQNSNNPVKSGGVYTALQAKANATELPYVMVTPGEWAFSGSGYDSGKEYKMSFSSEQSEWTLNESTEDSETPWIGIGTADGTGAELSVEFDTVSITATRASLPGHLLDRANNLVSVTQNTTLTLPLFVAGKVRDLLVACTVGVDGNDDPWSMTFQGQGSEAPNGADEISFKTESNDAAAATFPTPNAAGDWWYSLTECAPHVFAVSLKHLQSVSQPTQTQGGA